MCKNDVDILTIKLNLSSKYTIFLQIDNKEAPKYSLEFKKQIFSKLLDTIFFCV